VTAETSARAGLDRLAAAAAMVSERLQLRGAGSRGPLLAYGLYTLVLFVLCFVATFPHDLLVQRALRGMTAGTPIRIETGAGRVGWMLDYAVDGVRVRAGDDAAEPILSADSIRLAPSLLGLLRGTPFPLGLGASLYGGTLRGTIDPRPASFRVDATLAGVDLARYKGLTPWIEGAVRGRIDAAVALDGAGRGALAAAGPVTLRIPGLALEGTKIRGITVPDLHFGDVHLTGAVKNGRFEISEFIADGQEIGLRGEGNVLLRNPVESSVLSLELVVTPAAGAPDGLRLAVNMLPGSSGEGGARRIGIVGTLSRPTVR